MGVFALSFLEVLSVFSHAVPSPLSSPMLDVDVFLETNPFLNVKVLILRFTKVR